MLHRSLFFLSSDVLDLFALPFRYSPFPSAINQSFRQITKAHNRHILLMHWDLLSLLYCANRKVSEKFRRSTWHWSRHSVSNSYTAAMLEVLHNIHSCVRKACQ